MKNEGVKSVILITHGKRWRIYILLFTFFIIFTSGKPGQACIHPLTHRQDVTGQAIAAQIKKMKGDLYFPHTVERFYKLKGNKLSWIFPDTVKSHGWEVMLMLDCIVQFGLNHKDYHPDKLVSKEMHRLVTRYNKVSIIDKIAFDVMLTDALITFMNHLHYGKLNPFYSAKRIDQLMPGGFWADTSLIHAFKKPDFMSAVLSVQPQSKAYAILQSTMRLMTGQYVGDCYEFPEGEVRKIAVNMERLRWSDIGGEKYIQINIPSYTLRFQLPDTVYQFKVIAGSPSQLTPILRTKVSGFMTNTQFYEGSTISRQIIFRFKNPDHISLFGFFEEITLNSSRIFPKQEFIQVQQAQRLAELLLVHDGQKEKLNMLRNPKQNANFTLKNAVPIKITYLTCEVINGIVVQYDDTYKLDKNIENGLFLSTQH